LRFVAGTILQLSLKFHSQQGLMNPQKIILALVAIVATVGIVLISSIAVPALAVEKDTKSNPNTVKERDTGNEKVLCRLHNEEGRTLTKCQC
jgi:hypothetical protein